VLGDDARFVAFIDAAATNLGDTIDHRYPAEPGRGYLGSLIAFAILQHDLGLGAVRKVDPDAYLRTLASTLVSGLA
jgi:hypothetical protein